MENKSLTKIDKVLKKVREKEIFTIKDALKICRHPIYDVAYKFETPLNPHNQAKLANLEKANLWTIGKIFNGILLSDDPYSLVKLSEGEKYEFDKAFHQAKTSDKLDINIYRKKMAMKYAYLDSFTKKKATFTGKVPKSGLFSIRQVIADEWIQLFIEVIEIVLQHAYTYANDDSDYVMFPQQYIISYLLKHYPEDFDIEPNDNQLVYLMSAIPKFFYDVDVEKKVEKVHNS